MGLGGFALGNDGNDLCLRIITPGGINGERRQAAGGGGRDGGLAHAERSFGALQQGRDLLGEVADQVNNGIVEHAAKDQAGNEDDEYRRDPGTQAADTAAKKRGQPKTADAFNVNFIFRFLHNRILT